MSTSRISELSQRIAINTAKIDKYLNKYGLPQPSFAVDAPLKSIVPDHEVEIARARQEVINDTHELRRLLLGPREYLTSFNVSNYNLLTVNTLQVRILNSFVAWALKSITRDPGPLCDPDEQVQRTQS